MRLKNSINCDLECKDKGSKWSVAFAMNSVVYMLIAFNAVLMIAGVYLVWLRVTSMCCNCCLSIINLAAIITTAVFRFRKLGKLCALSIEPVKVESET